MSRLAADRRERLLDASEVCFVRAGFDCTTMQDIAREAAMSPANIYRYFESKEALVIALVEREYQRGAALIERLQNEGNERTALLGIVDHYYLQITREVAILRLDIMSEATRNPVIARHLEKVDADGRVWLHGILSRLATSANCDLVRLRIVLETILRGIIVGRALVSDYDPAPMGAHYRTVLDAGLAGRLDSVLGRGA